MKTANITAAAMSALHRSERVIPCDDLDRAILLALVRESEPTMGTARVRLACGKVEECRYRVLASGEMTPDGRFRASLGDFAATVEVRYLNGQTVTVNGRADDLRLMQVDEREYGYLYDETGDY